MKEVPSTLDKNDRLLHENDTIVFDELPTIKWVVTWVTSKLCWCRVLKTNTSNPIPLFHGLTNKNFTIV